MIKFFATDMDGTLLDDEKKLDEEIFPLIKEMKQRGILFAAASGRQFPSLYRIFAPVRDDIYFISDNGAFIYYQRRELYSSIMPQELWKKILEHADALGNVEPMICSKYTAYTTNSISYEIMKSDKFHYEMTLVPDLQEVKDDIIKVSFLDTIDVYGNSFLSLKPIFGEYADMAVSGYNCLDIMNKDVNKGMAIRKIQETAGIQYDETAAFGDNYNDIEMLEEAAYSFAMENAHDDVKQHARYICGNNNDHVVVKEIKRYLADSAKGKAQ